MTDLFLSAASVWLVIALATNLRSGLRDDRISYGHAFGKSQYVDRVQSPRVFYSIVACHWFGLLACALGILSPLL